MKRSIFRDLLSSLYDAEREIDDTKGKGYAEGYASDADDALANFKRLAMHLDLTPLQICAVYLGKHFDAIMSYAKHGKDITGECLFGRVADLRLYAALFLALARDKELEEAPFLPQTLDGTYFSDEANPS